MSPWTVRLRELGLTLPAVAAATAGSAPAVLSGGHVHTAGQFPLVRGVLPVSGAVGAELCVEQAADLARTAALNALAAIDAVAGIDSVVRIVRMVGYVASAPGFTGQAAVLDGASELLHQVFGERGAAARTAVGVLVLPYGSPVEVELLAEVTPDAPPAPTRTGTGTGRAVPLGDGRGDRTVTVGLHRVVTSSAVTLRALDRYPTRVGRRRGPAPFRCAGPAGPLPAAELTSAVAAPGDVAEAVRLESCREALGRGDYEQAYQEATALAGEAGPWVAMDLVEAAVHTRRHAEAAAYVAGLDRAGIAGLSPRLALLVAGAAALAAPDEVAPGLFEAALAVPGAGRWTFDLARIRLAYGERLRRTGSCTGARVQLAAALETFDRLGAAPWSARAGAELRATGRTRSRPGRLGPAGLTPQEYEIAQHAAAGLTNKEIAARLYLSHRTVGSHLHHAFPKLGVTSRAALRDALTRTPAPDR